jgi:hypothetical protein
MPFVQGTAKIGFTPKAHVSRKPTQDALSLAEGRFARSERTPAVCRILTMKISNAPSGMEIRSNSASIGSQFTRNPPPPENG